MYGLNDEIVGLRQDLEKVTKERDVLKATIKDLEEHNKKVGEIFGDAMLKKLDGALTMLYANRDMTEGHRKELIEENQRLREEIQVLRFFGNKDCTSMADEELERRRKKEKED